MPKRYAGHRLSLAPFKQNMILMALHLFKQHAYFSLFTVEARYTFTLYHISCCQPQFTTWFTNFVSAVSAFVHTSSYSSWTAAPEWLDWMTLHLYCSTVHNATCKRGMVNFILFIPCICNSRFTTLNQQMYKLVAKIFML